MLRILFSLFTIAMIFVSFTHEVHEVMSEVQLKVKKVESHHNISAPEHCDGHDSDPDHCHIHCTGLHFLVDIYQSEDIATPEILRYQKIHFENQFFQSPYLDPAIKPPSLA